MYIGKHPGGRPRKELSNKIEADPVNGVFYTVPEAAALLGVHVRTLQSRLREGSIKGKKIGGIWRIYKTELFKDDSGQ